MNCMLAARNEDTCGELSSPGSVRSISGIRESEANSIIRGMDMTGHAEFARCGLEFYLKQCNAAATSRSTSIATSAATRSSAPARSCGHIGEHYQRTGDQAWLRKVAPDVVRICQWVIRQREKTKRLDARGRESARIRPDAAGRERRLEPLRLSFLQRRPVLPRPRDGRHGVGRHRRSCSAGDLGGRKRVPRGHC